MATLDDDLSEYKNAVYTKLQNFTNDVGKWNLDPVALADLNGRLVAIYQTLPSMNQGKLEDLDKHIDQRRKELDEQQ